MRAPRASTRLATWPAVLLTLGLLALYLSQRHDGLFENGPELMELWRRGMVVHTHALLLPLARLAGWLGLAGSPVVPDRAVSLISCLGAALAVAVVVVRAASWTGALEALLAGLVLGLAPVLRFYAGAVETRALGCGCAAVAGVLASYAAPTRARALVWLTVGYALACAAHVSLVVLGPALLLLHADAERRAGRPVTLARLAGAAAALAGGALATGGAIYAADQLLNPVLPNTSSWMLYYFQVSSDWGTAVGRPHPLTWVLTEIVGPFDALLPLALVGVLPLLRRAPWRAAALLVWTLLVAVTSYGIGSRQLGGYFLAALPALGWFAAEGLQHLLRARSARAALASAALALVGLLALPSGLGAWYAGGADAAFGAGAHRPWLVQRSDLALPSVGFPGAALAAPHPFEWLGVCAVACLLAGAIKGGGARGPSLDPSRVAQPDSQPDAQPASPSFARGAPTLALVAVALALQLAGGETFRERWPIHWSQQTRDYCEAARARLGPHDRLFTAVHTTGVAWQFNYYIGERWTDLGQESYLEPEARGAWLAGVEAELASVRAHGGTAFLAKNGLVLLEERRNESPLALAAAQRWLSEGLVVLWSPQP